MASPYKTLTNDLAAYKKEQEEEKTNQEAFCTAVMADKRKGASKFHQQPAKGAQLGQERKVDVQN